MSVVAILVGGMTLTALWGVMGLSRNLDASLAIYDTLQFTHEVGLELTAVRPSLNSSTPDLEDVYRRLGALTLKIQEERQRPRPAIGEEDASAILKELATIRAEIPEEKFDDSSRATASNASTLPVGAIAEIEGRVNTLLSRVAAMGATARLEIERLEAESRHRRDASVMVTLGLLGVTLLTIVGFLSFAYKSVVSPLQELRQAVGRVAERGFRHRIPETGDLEFAQLATEFNRMAQELDRLYRELEERIAHKSRELSQAERMASVGFLAAGVAHEINNPLAIISGHAELSLRALNGKPTLGATDEIRRTLEIVRDEAFRCKQITDKLLSMSRGGGEALTLINVSDSIRHVAELVRGLRKYEDRRVDMDIPSTPPLSVMASETEIRQVLLNLVVNALEAVEAGKGLVRIEAVQRDNYVMIEVIDNGRGMTESTLARAFEPFYSERPGDPELGSTPGTGLGLSLSLAIIDRHHGRLTANSDGPGRGSRFTIQLPGALNRAATEQPMESKGADGP